MEQKIEDVLQQVVEDKTFSLEAVEAIKALREENQKLRTQNESQLKQLSNLRDELAVAKKEVTDLRGRLDRYIIWEEGIKDREKAVLRTEIQNEHLQARCAELKGIIDNLTRNTMVRQRVFGNENLVMPGYESGGYQYGPQTMQQPFDRTTESEEV